MTDLEDRLSAAVRHFWSTRQKQADKQHAEGEADAGSRSSVTGGKQMDAFIELIRDVLLRAGCPARSLFPWASTVAPGAASRTFRSSRACAAPSVASCIVSVARCASVASMRSIA